MLVSNGGHFEPLASSKTEGARTMKLWVIIVHHIATIKSFQIFIILHSVSIVLLDCGLD